MKQIIILIYFSLFSSVSLSQETQLFKIRLLLPDTLSRSNIPDSFAIEIEQLVEGNLKISSPEYANNMNIYLLKEMDTVMFYNIHSPKDFLIRFITLGETDTLWYKASHVLKYLKYGTHVLLPVFFGFIDFENKEIVSTHEDIFKGKYCLCEPKKIVVIE
jgi:hypothetical protein